jgi:protein-S-isoprenylcysteine O-methyltransferase Ste14
VEHFVDRLVAIKGVIADVRTHAANWREVERRTGSNPQASIALYLMRFVLILAGIASAAWYWLKHDWTLVQGLLICVPGMLGFLVIWTTLERRTWNSELRSKGLSTEAEVWSVTEFPT